MRTNNTFSMLLLLNAIYQTFFIRLDSQSVPPFLEKSKLHDFALESTFAEIIFH